MLAGDSIEVRGDRGAGTRAGYLGDRLGRWKSVRDASPKLIHLNKYAKLYDVADVSTGV